MSWYVVISAYLLIKRLQTKVGRPKWTNGARIVYFTLVLLGKTQF